MDKHTDTLSSVIQSRSDREVFSTSEKNTLRDHISEHVHAEVIDTGSLRSTSIGVWKRMVSGALVACLGLVFYGIWGAPSGTVFDHPVFTVFRGGQSTTPRVFASSVGQVVTADGEYSIVNDGVTYHTNMLYNGDSIELAHDARLSFEVDGHQAYIIGPALVRIDRDQDGYHFRMQKGEFLEIYSSHVKTGSHLTIEMNDLVLAHDPSDATMKVQLTATNDTTVIKNYADPVHVVRRDDNQDTKNIATSAQLTVASSDSLTQAKEESFSMNDVVFVSDSSSAVDDARVSLAALTDDVRDAPVVRKPSQDVSANIPSTTLEHQPSNEDVASFVRVAEVLDSEADGDVTMSVAVNVADDSSHLRLPTTLELNLLDRLMGADSQTIATVWSDMTRAYGCMSLSSEDSTQVVRSCVSDIISSYHIPPSTVRSLWRWLDNEFPLIDEGNTVDSPVVETGSALTGDDIVNSVPMTQSGSVTTGGVVGG